MTTSTFDPGAAGRPLGSRSAQARHEGHIQAGGIDKDVLFVNAAQDLDDQVEAAYRTKYTPIAPSYVEPMVSPETRARTVKVVPRAPRTRDDAEAQTWE